MDTATGSARRMTAAERRAQLLQVTKAMVGAEGFHTVTIEAVARRAGVSRPVVYEHFGGLRGLFDALLDLLSRTALEQLAAVLPRELGGRSPKAVLLGALRGYLEVAEADPVTWRLVLMPAECAPKAARERIAEGRSRVVAQLAAAVAPGFVAGREVPDPELMALMLVTTADELARLVLTQPTAYPVERMLAHAGWLLGQFEAGGELKASSSAADGLCV